MTQPFLTIMTRCCKRPKMLAANIRSVLAQTDRDIEQVFLVDHIGHSVYWANKQLVRHKGRAEGDFVYILDDDCRLTNPEFVKRLRRAAKAKPKADIVMVRSRRSQLKPHTLPRNDVWGRRERLPMRANCLCYAVRREPWQAYIESFVAKAGAGRFLSRLLDEGLAIAWLDAVVAETQQLGRGVKFEDCGPGWWRQVAREFGIKKVVQGDWRLRLWEG